MSTQRDHISFTVKVKLAYGELLFEIKTLKYNVIKPILSLAAIWLRACMWL